MLRVEKLERLLSCELRILLKTRLRVADGGFGGTSLLLFDLLTGSQIPFFSCIFFALVAL